MEIYQLSITKVIIILNVVVSIIGFTNGKFLDKFIFNPYIISTKKEYWRFLTAAFLHGNIIHLAINMFVLLQFGQELELKFNRFFHYQKEKVILCYLSLYLPAIIVSCLFSYFKHRRNPDYNALGASGAIAAIVFAYIGIKPLERLYLLGLLKMPAFAFAALFLLVSWFLGRSSKDNIGHDAHFFGALFGFAFIFAIRPSLFTSFLFDIQVYFQNLF